MDNVNVEGPDPVAANRLNKSVIIDHLCRVEGHGGIDVEIQDGKVTKVKMDIFEGSRFFEALLTGRSYDEAAPIASRVCAICSVGHTLTALMAVEDAFGVEPNHKTKILRELLFHGMMVESHALHLFCLAVPDFLGYTGAISLAADDPETVKFGLGLKKLGNTIQEVVGGRAIHPVNAIIGGFGKVPGEQQLIGLRQELAKALGAGRRVIELMEGLAVPDFSESPVVYVALGDDGDGYGFFGNEIRATSSERFAIDDYEKITNESVVTHSHAKHSRLNERPYMVGSLARLTLNGNKLKGMAREAMDTLLDLPSQNILHNNTAQAVELIFSLERSLEIIDELLAGGLVDEPPVPFEVKAGTGTAATEVPRGTLYHSYTIDDSGTIVRADVITPTAQNLANIEKDLRATAGRLADKPAEEIRRNLEMVVRAYDPCISCSVH